MKERIMIISSIFLLLVSGAVSVYPDSFENFTGLNTSSIEPIEFGELENRQDRVCGSLNLNQSQNVTEVTDGISLEDNASKGYLHYNLDNVNRSYIFWNKADFGILDSYDPWAVILVNSNPNTTLTSDEIFYSGSRISEIPLASVPGTPADLRNLNNVSNLTVKIYDHELVVNNVVNACSYNPSEDSGQSDGVLSIFSFISDFSTYVGNFFGAVFSIIGNLFSLLTLSGNVISEWILRIVMVPQIIFWAYVIVDTLGSFFG